MKTSKIKSTIIECKMKDSLVKKEFNIDSDVFDDVQMEAATRFAEQHILNKCSKIPPILTAYIKEDSEDYDKHISYNSYYIIIFAGFHRKAEIMRKNFLSISNIDLQKEPIQNAKSL